MMIDINPFCDNDIRNGLQYLSGVNLMIIIISIVVDVVAILENFEFSGSWNPDSFLLPAYAAYILLGCGIFVNFLQLLGGWTLYSSVSQKSYRKVNQLYWPSIILVVIELSIIICYLVCIPSSPYFYYFTLFNFLFKVYLLWPLKRFINDNYHMHIQRPRVRPTERTRLLASVA